jgi:2-octaprenyl-6-methoxyphenol hydroxylase
MGPLTLCSPRQVWPIISQAARRLTAPRVALVAEAAHVMPPIGAQGLNMSLRDLATLHGLVAAAPADPGAPQLLQAYARARHPDIALRVAGIDLLNRASITGAAPLQALRAAGMRALHDVTPVRRALMRLGLGAGGGA